MTMGNDSIKLSLVSYLDLNLSLMVKPKAIDLNSTPSPKVRDELFSELDQELSLETILHLYPYPLG